jgi:hypothetical protein
MRSFRRFKMRRGFAMIFVILIALAMIIPVLILAASTIPRRTAVTGEAISDRVLAVADATVDNVLTQINNFPFTFVASSSDDPDQASALKKVEDYLVAYHLALLNGGFPDLNNILGSEHVSGSLLNIENNVSTYLYNLETQEYYVVWDSTITPDYPNGHIANVSMVEPDGAIKTGTLKNFSTGNLISGGIQSIAPNYKTDNLWIEIDTRSGYVADQWEINITSYMLSKPEIKRTIKAVASRGNLQSDVEEHSTPQQELANGNWYTRTTDVYLTTVYFSDYSGLYHTRVYFGKYETTRGMIRSDSDLYMGGWAEDPVYAHGTVYDIAIDDNNRHDGRFGPDQENLAWAKTTDPKYATNGYPAATWPNGDLALTGTNPVKVEPGDPNGGLQDKAASGYYISGDATIVFSVVNGVGKVSINNGSPMDMPTNGAIYVTGTATVSGTVDGRCTVGAGNNINIGGDIIYNTPPRVNKDDPVTGIPDSLGLIAFNSLIIPVTTFNANSHQLEVDAAMLAVHGSFGIGSGYSPHNIDGSGKYQAWWNGCQAMWSTSNAPAIVVSGSSIEGYDVQHTNYDWNLYSYGAPPYYPLTNSYSQEHKTVAYPLVTDSNILAVLRQLNKGQLVQINPGDSDYDSSYPYKYYYEGTWYYYGTTFNIIPGSLSYSATAQMNSTPLYRITWKEQVAQPIEPGS